MRINKFIAHATNISRREADNAIAAGRVHVNGRVAGMGVQVESDDIVRLDGKILGGKTTYTYLALNKPVGYLCSRRSQGGVPTIYSLLPEGYRPLKAVGRLDKDSSGIILLTDDGDFAFQMTHPSFHKVKVYEVELNRPLEPLHQQMISDHGINLEDGQSQFIIERLEQDAVQGDFDTSATSQQRGATEKATSAERGGEIALNRGYRITMHEGRNRQIRRTFSALGYTVTKLHRTNFGNYSLGDIKSGSYAVLDIH